MRYKIGDKVRYIGYTYIGDTEYGLEHGEVVEIQEHYKKWPYFVQFSKPPLQLPPLICSEDELEPDLSIQNVGKYDAEV